MKLDKLYLPGIGYRALLLVLAAHLAHQALAGPLAGRLRVDVQAGAIRAAETVANPCDPATLPDKVQEMQEAIRDAAKSGNFESLRTPIEWNELKPDFGAPPGVVPIAHLLALSGDGTGKQLLAQVLAVLDAGCSAPAASDKDGLFVWPRLAGAALATLTPEEVAALERLVGAAAAKDMRQSGRYTGWRLVIGRDGTWHSFKKAE